MASAETSREAERIQLAACAAMEPSERVARAMAMAGFCMAKNSR